MKLFSFTSNFGSKENCRIHHKRKRLVRNSMQVWT